MSERLRAPQEDGAVLAVPSLAEMAGRVTATAVSLAASRVALLGVPLGELRAASRRQALAAADHYHWQNGEPVPEAVTATAPLVVAGHQPELFHPGVWAKNFALAHLAARTGGVALNLLVDSDTLKTASLRVPYRDGVLRSVPYDRWTAATPWEERRVLEPATFAAFGPAVMDALSAWGLRPLLADLWANLLTDAQTVPLGEAFARGRRRLERAWGVSNREVPLSRLWSTLGFARLAGAILADLPRFRAVHNEALRAYRVAHGIKSRQHPVADLEPDEAPFWIWRRGTGRRERLFVRGEGGRLHLNVLTTLPVPESDAFARSWCALNAAGVCVRSKALTTTLAARLLLADGFVHGLGGGLYDALTDVILREFIGIEPPPFVILTATRRLPLPREPDAQARRDALARLVRDLRYNPQRYSDDAALCAERAAWVARQPTTPEERRERFVQLRRLNGLLTMGERLVQAERDLAEARDRVRVAEMLGRRDFSFVLFPEASLRGLLTALSSVSRDAPAERVG